MDSFVLDRMEVEGLQLAVTSPTMDHDDYMMSTDRQLGLRKKHARHYRGTTVPTSISQHRQLTPSTVRVLEHGVKKVGAFYSAIKNRDLFRAASILMNPLRKEQSRTPSDTSVVDSGDESCEPDFGSDDDYDETDDYIKRGNDGSNLDSTELKTLRKCWNSALVENNVVDTEDTVEQSETDRRRQVAEKLLLSLDEFESVWSQDTKQNEHQLVLSEKHQRSSTSASLANFVFSTARSVLPTLTKTTTSEQLLSQVHTMRKVSVNQFTRYFLV